ncbi:MAG TPA: asparagine synthase (glutamine-hydrolyzing) [Steroidobacteraceae bacterium]|nr:asparagine synthase (glutamine-hydrolyzing) [Steroidobacteraceae bacterium]
MCGIVGVLNLQRAERVDPTIVERMRDTMPHRGPDGVGLWSDPEGQVVLGHRRLSIIDLSTVANQPMCNEDGTVWVTYNGEIYNHQALRAELVSHGHKFRTDHSDTEVIVHGYEQWGLEGLARRIAGDYGIGLYDLNRGELHLIRDRIGVKPLYFGSRDGVFAFGSEIKALLAHPRFRPDIEPVAMYHYLSFLTTPAPLTMFRGIFKLPPGCALTVSQGTAPRIKRYWDAVPGLSEAASVGDSMSDEKREQFYIEGIRRRLEESVGRRMMSDVPFGVFLSGGVDSSTNVALMARLMNRPVDTFTVGFSDHTHLNELDQARSIAQHFKTNHHEVLVQQRDMEAYLDQLIHSQDEPIADWVCIPLYFVSKLARDCGTTVVQVGEGSDEQFCGYGTYMAYLKLQEKYWSPYRRYVPKPLRRLVSMGANLAVRARPSLAPYSDILERAARDREVFWTGAHVFWDVIKRRLVRDGAFQPSPELVTAAEAGIVDPGYLVPDSFNVVRSFLEPFDRDHPGRDTLTRMIYNEFRLRLPELLLMRVDKIGMSTTIEARVPFLDHELVEFSMDIPQRFKVRNGEPKYLLKKAVEGLIPHEVIYRKKMGFGAPMSNWLRGDFGRRVQRDLLESRLLDSGYFNREFVAQLCADHLNGRADYSLYIWSLFNLVAWYDYWVDDQRAR